MKIPNKFNPSLFGLIIIYLITRLYNLLILPIFTDESIYIYWAKIIATTHSHWFISLTDGKPPLLVWMTAIFLKIFPSQWYLLAGRLPSVIAGTLTLIGIYKISKILFKSEKVAIIASVLYILNPFSLLYDRMALFDSLLTSMLLWTVYFAIKTATTRSLKDAFLWGLFLGLAYLSKPTAGIFLLLTPICFLLSYQGKWKNNWKQLIVLIGVPLFIGECINNLQRLSHVYYLMSAKNQQFQQPIDKLLKNPFELTLGNLHGFFSWLIPYYTGPIFIVGLIAFIILLRKKLKECIILFLLWFAPIFILATVGREIFPRYILFTTPYFLIAIAYLINWVWIFSLTNHTVESSRGGMFFEQAHRVLSPDGVVGVSLGRTQKNMPTSANGWNKTSQFIVRILLTLVILIPSIRFDYLLLTNPPASPLPDSDYHQYISEHPSGYGLDKIFYYLNVELQNGPLTLITQGTFGLYPYAFNLEYWDNKNLTIIPRWPLSTIDQEILDRAKSEKIYILLKEYDQIPANLPLHLILRAKKPGGKYPILLTTLK